MTSGAEPQTDRRRVRTGCLPCRKRRRKCDEHRPACVSCTQRGATCQYPGFKNFSVLANTDTSSSVGRRETRAPSTTTVDFIALAPPNARPEPQRAFTEPLPRSDNIQPSSQEGLTPDDSASATTFSGARLSISQAASSGQRGTFEEVSLLRHYRYYLAPWLDVTDPNGFFGVKLLALATERKALLAALLSLSIKHRALLNKDQTAGSNSEAFRPEQTIQELIHTETNTIQRLIRLLSKLAEVLSLSPYRWASAAMEICLLPDMTSFDIIEESIFWTSFKIDLATCIVLRRSSRIHADIWQAWREYDRSKRDAISDCRSIFFALALCVQLELNQDPPLCDHASPTSPVMQHIVHTQWSELWNECQVWHRDRPYEMRQILSCRSTQAGRIDPDSSAFFPIEIYSSPTAMIHNAVYHMASLLLLARRPRHIEVHSTSKQALSEGWHMQSIAGACERNNFKEQWDPILIAGLFMIAPKMTHDSQQQALMTCFERASSSTGIDLSAEILDLRNSWQI